MGSRQFPCCLHTAPGWSSTPSQPPSHSWHQHQNRDSNLNNSPGSLSFSRHWQWTPRGANPSGNTLAAPGTRRAQSVPGMLGQQHRQWEIHTGWTGITGQLPELQYPWCWWDECHSWNAGMEGAGRGRFDTTALMVNADGGEPLDEDQGMENKGGAAVGSTPERAMCRLKKTTTHWAEYSLFCHLQQWPQQPEKLLFSSAFTQHKQDKGQGNIRVPPYVSRREQNGAAHSDKWVFPISFCLNFTQLLGLFHISWSFPAFDVWILMGSGSEVANFVLFLPGQEFVTTTGGWAALKERKELTITNYKESDWIKVTWKHLKLFLNSAGYLCYHKDIWLGIRRQNPIFCTP